VSPSYLTEAAKFGIKYIKNISNLGAKYSRKVLDVSLVGEEYTVHCSLYRRSCIQAGGAYCSWNSL